MPYGEWEKAPLALLTHRKRKSESRLEKITFDVHQKQGYVILHCLLWCNIDFIDSLVPQFRGQAL